MAPGGELVGLLRQVQAARTPLERLQRVALAWRTVRSLAPAERTQLAQEIGLDGAEALLERLATRHGGLAPAALLEAIRAAQRAGSLRLDGFLSETGRRELLIQGLDQMEERLGAAALEAVETPPTPAVSEAEGQLAAVRPVAAAAPPAPAPAAAAPTSSHRAARPPEPAPSAERPAPPPPSPPVRPAVASPPLPRRAEGDGSAVGEAATGAEVAALASEPSIARRLRRLERLVAETVVDSGHARRLAAVFPDGWQRRRAVLAILRAAGPGGVELLGDLVALLAHPRDRRWCARTASGAHRITE